MRRERYEHLPVAQETAENAVLGRMLMFAETVPVGLFYCARDDFEDPIRRAAFEAMERLAAKHAPIGVESVALELRTADVSLQTAGVRLIDATLAVAGPAHAEHFARILAQLGDDARLRRAARVIATGTSDSADIEQLETALRDAARARAGRPEPIGSVLVGRLRELEAESEGRGSTARVMTGISEIDRRGGLRAPEVWVVGARPRMGKTALALQIAEHAARKGQRVLFYSLEMGRDEIADRLLARAANISSTRIRIARISPDEWPALNRSAREMHEVPLEISDSGRMSILELVADAERAALAGPAVSLVVVDYVQLVTATNRRESREQEVAEVSRSLKALAKSIGAPVIALAQLNRQLETRQGDRRPGLSDLRESGSLEQDADVVAFLHRPVVFDPLADPFAAELIISKRRHGAPGTIALRFDGSRMTFSNAQSQDSCPEQSYFEQG